MSIRQNIQVSEAKYPSRLSPAVHRQPFTITLSGTSFSV